MKDKLVDVIYSLLEKYGIDAFYAATVFSVLGLLYYWRVYKNWDNEPQWRQGLAGSAAFAAIVFSVMSLLRLLGILDF